MRILTFLVYLFVNTFGITQPTAAGARRAARYLGVALGLMLLAAATAALIVRSVIGPG